MVPKSVTLGLVADVRIIFVFPERIILSVTSPI